MSSFTSPHKTMSSDFKWGLVSICLLGAFHWEEEPEEHWDVPLHSSPQGSPRCSATSYQDGAPRLLGLWWNDLGSEVTLRDWPHRQNMRDVWLWRMYIGKVIWGILTNLVVNIHVNDQYVNRNSIHQLCCAFFKKRVGIYCINGIKKKIK